MAGELVRSARERARMSARDLAAKSGVSTSTVTRIERGEINPTVTMLQRLIDASGNELVVTVHPRPDRPTLGALRERRDEILDIVASLGGSNVRVSDGTRARRGSPVVNDDRRRLDDI